jgi:DNA-binding LacI/PurR family transcriptional regulator
MSLLPRRPTAADVARKSGVSTATVSYVLNNTAGQSIKEATRQKVLVAARELGYVKHAAAQTLARGASRLVLLDMSAVPSGALVQWAARAISQRLEAEGLIPLISWWESADSTCKLVSLARSVVPTAVVTAVPLPARMRRELAAAGVHTVLSLAPTARDLEKLVAAAAHAQVHYLASSGAARIIFAPPSDPQLARLARVRWRAVEEASAALEIEAVALSPNATDADVDEALCSALDLRSTATAVAAYNDEVAIGVLARAHRLGIAVPVQLPVIGIDDLPVSSLTIPTLTTIRYHLSTHNPIQTFIEELRSPDGGTAPAQPTGGLGFIHVEVVQRESA